MRCVGFASFVLPLVACSDCKFEGNDECTSLLSMTLTSRTRTSIGEEALSFQESTIEAAIDADSRAAAQAVKAYVPTSREEEAGSVKKREEKGGGHLKTDHSRQRDLLQSSIDAAVAEADFDTSVVWPLPDNSGVATSQGSQSTVELACGAGAASHVLWNCDDLGLSTRLQGDHPDAEPQRVLEASVAEMCAKPEVRAQLETRLDCRSTASYLRHADPESGWLDEAYLSYLGGSPNSEYILATDNLIRSAHMFSDKPIVLVIIGDDYVLPASWQRFPNLILYRMDSLMPGLGFNFNKNRAIIGARIKTGIQLDGDQIVASPRMDSMFEATRSHCTAQYPFPIPPVHWMSREAGPTASLYDNKYAFNLEDYDYDGPRSMRWVHAHPTYTYHAVPFFHDILLVKYTALMWPGTTAKVWDLHADRPMDLPTLLSRGTAGRVERQCINERWMYSDEPMLNVHLWKANATRHWCKMDLEPDLYLAANLPSNFYWDRKWYPDGIPLMFYSVHNTKRFPETLVLLAYLDACVHTGGPIDDSCAHMSPEAQQICTLSSPQEMQVAMERDADLFTSAACCCLSPRLTTPILWQHRYFYQGDQLPEHNLGEARGEQMCLTA